MITTNKALRTELLQHSIDTLKDLILSGNFDRDKFRYHGFNEDYYIIGYYQASEWLKLHNIDAFEAIAKVMEWEQEVFGEVMLKPTDINSESVVNHLVYILGEELLNEFDYDLTSLELLAEMEGER